MKQVLEAIDQIIDILRRGDSSLAGVLLLALRAKLTFEMENEKLKREAGRELGLHKKKMIASIKKMKL